MEHSGNIPIFNIPGTIFREQYSGNNICEYYSQFLRALFLNIPGIYHGNVPRIYICPTGSLNTQSYTGRSSTTKLKVLLNILKLSSISLVFKNQKLVKLISKNSVNNTYKYKYTTIYVHKSCLSLNLSNTTIS